MTRKADEIRYHALDYTSNHQALGYKLSRTQVTTEFQVLNENDTRKIQKWIRFFKMAC